MEHESILILILLMAVVTALPRLAPFWLISGRKFSPFLQRWLGLVPVTVLAAMAGPDLLLRGGHLFLTPANDYLWAGLASLAVGIWRRNLALTVGAGIVAVAILRGF